MRVKFASMISAIENVKYNRPILIKFIPWPRVKRLLRYDSLLSDRLHVVSHHK